MTLDTRSRTSSPEGQLGSTHSKRPLTARQAAAFLGFDEKTITRWARHRYIPAHPVGEGKRKFWRFFEDELVAWLSAQTNVAVTR